MLADYHIHLEEGAFSVDWLKLFWERAKQIGLREIGIAEHCHRFLESQPILDFEWVRQYRCLTLEQYVSLVEEARKQGIPVKLGIEMDYVPGRERQIEEFLDGYPWDYVIGSVHWDGEFPFDFPEVKWDPSDVDGIYRRYFKILAQAIESGLFDVIAHLDVVKANGSKPEIALWDYYQDTALLLGRFKVCVEVNTAGNRKPAREFYPAFELLKACFDQGVPIIISSDAHLPEHVGYQFREAVDYARRAGYSSVAAFSGRNLSMWPLELKPSSQHVERC